MDVDVVLKRFEQPDEVREFDKGRFEVVHLGGMTIGRATYEPGWNWSEHVGKPLGQSYCRVEHVCMVLGSTAAVATTAGSSKCVRAPFSMSRPALRGTTAG